MADSISVISEGVKPKPAQPRPERQAERRHVRGGVTVVTVDSPGCVIEGQLMDVSCGGFRFSHHDRGLRSGQKVAVVYPWGQLQAQVVWTRISADGVESGCMVLGSK